MTVKEWQVQVDQWIKTIGVRYFDIKTNMILLMEEVGELSRHIARHHGEQSYKSKDQEDQAKEKIKEEMADVLFVLTCMANQEGIDLEEIMDQTMRKKTKRDIDRHLNNEKLR